MKHNLFETVLGAIVLLIAAVFLLFSYRSASVGKVTGYNVTANFSGVGGLRVGDDVRISGVKVGSVAGVDLDPETYLARVRLSISPSVKLPDDTAAAISSESLLGGLFMSLEPGASDDMLSNGGRIQYTQSPQNLEQLLGQFIFSMQGSKDGKGDEVASSATANDNP